MRLQTPDDGAVEGPMVPGAPCADAPVTRPDGRAGWLLEHLGGAFTLLRFGPDSDGPTDLGNLRPALRLIHVDGEARETVAGEVLGDPEGLAGARYGGVPGVSYLIRPDQHVAARFARYDSDAVRAALARATAKETP
jgi:3-(3-hydroxy-phenyl)propionate hydroxylase